MNSWPSAIPLLSEAEDPHLGEGWPWEPEGVQLGRVAETNAGEIPVLSPTPQGWGV